MSAMLQRPEMQASEMQAAEMPAAEMQAAASKHGGGWTIRGRRLRAASCVVAPGALGLRKVVENRPEHRRGPHPEIVLDRAFYPVLPLTEGTTDP